MSSFRILSLQAKDAYNSIVAKADGGVCIRSKDGEIRHKLFSATLDWSLDTERLQKAYNTKYRRNFYFCDKYRFRYTQAVINVDFDYSFKEFNQCNLYVDGKRITVYIRAGYSMPTELENGALVVDGKVVAIALNVEVDVNHLLGQELLGKAFKIVDNHYELGTVDTIMSKAELREYLYEHGFDCDGIHYVRYKRSSGSSRVGKCLFIDENLHEAMARYDRCYLAIEDGDEIDLPAYEAYIALPMSSIVGTIEIQPENILVIDDYESVFDNEVVAVSEISGSLSAKKTTTTIRNSIWDGQSLLDTSYFTGPYAGKGMLLLRNRFFKSCCFNTSLQQFFADNGITDVSQLNGRTKATCIEDIKLITTPSSIKYLKFGPLSNWLKAVNTMFGVVKFEKPTHFFDGDLVKTSYQLINTLQLSRDEVTELLTPSFDYIEAIRSQPEVMRYDIKLFGSDQPNEELAMRLCTSDVQTLPTKNETILALMGLNDRVVDTKMYNDFVNEVTRSKYRELRKGRILVRGNYSTLFGNGFEMLLASIGQFDGRGIFEKGYIYSKAFKSGEMLLCARSPHITMGNVLVKRNIQCDAIDTYFNLTNEIVCVNSIEENTLQALNGADFDSDTVLITNNPILLRAAIKNEGRFLVPTSLVESIKTRRHYTSHDLADLDVKTSENHIGEIVNLSQQLNSLLWDRVNRGESIDDCDELYMDICKLAVLSGIEIDKAKREFTIDTKAEMAALRRKYQKKKGDKTIKPFFFKTITKENGYELSENIAYTKFETSMDFVQTKVNGYSCRRGARRESFSPLYEVITRPANDGISSNYTYRDRAVEAIVELRRQLTRLNLMDATLKAAGDNEARATVLDTKRQSIADFYKLFDASVKSPYIIYLVLKKVDDMQYSVKTETMKALCKTKLEMLRAMIMGSATKVQTLERNADGSVSLYGLRFSMI